METRGSNARAEGLQQVGEWRELEGLLGKERRVLGLWVLTWCPFCRNFLPLFRKHTGALAGVTPVLVNDDRESLGERYGVEVYPSILLFENGALVRRLDGIPGKGLSERQLADFVAALG